MYLISVYILRLNQPFFSFRFFKMSTLPFHIHFRVCTVTETLLAAHIFSSQSETKWLNKMPRFLILLYFSSVAL